MRLIVINGIARGGTNILWNIIASHPEIVLLRYETGEMFYELRSRGVINKLFEIFHKNDFFRMFYAKRLRMKLDHLRHLLLDDADQGQISPDARYTIEELERTAICLKSLNMDLRYICYINQLYPDTKNVGIVRNGYAVLNGFLRRGISAKNAGNLYRTYSEMILDQSETLKNYRIVHFEDIIQNPFESAAELFDYLGFDTGISHLRFKVKKTLSEEGEHSADLSRVNGHYWFSKNSISTYINPEINDIQIGHLSAQEIKDFEKEAMPILEYFNYSIK